MESAVSPKSMRRSCFNAWAIFTQTAASPKIHHQKDPSKATQPEEAQAGFAPCVIPKDGFEISWHATKNTQTSVGTITVVGAKVMMRNPTSRRIGGEGNRTNANPIMIKANTGEATMQRLALHAKARSTVSCAK
jgi:hypothetical protein